MSYKALYRTYRPASFNDVVGQKHIVQTIKNAITLNKISHAYLFTGPRGTGKTSIAKIFATTLNCLNLSSDLTPCGRCEVCAGVRKNNIQDIIELDAASHNSADDIRNLRETVKFLPTVSRYKVYIIDEVHMLSNAAFNALLKTLEEPPSYVIFILATTEAYKLPNTILSRVQRYDFKNISDEDIIERLEYIAKNENIKTEPKALKKIALEAKGGLRDALSIFDQVISYAGNNPITVNLVQDILGSIDEDELLNFLMLLLDKDYVKCFSVIDNLIINGKDINRILIDLITFIKDILIYQETKEATFVLSDNHIKTIQGFNKQALLNIIKHLNEALNNMRFSLQKKAFIDCFILNCCSEEITSVSVLKEVKLEEKKIITDLSSKDLKTNTTTLSNQVIRDEKLIEKNINTQYVKTNKVLANTHMILPKDLAEVLLNFNKDLRQELSRSHEEINILLANDRTDSGVEAFIRSEIVCSSDTCFIVKCSNLRDATNIMKSKLYLKILNHFKAKFMSLDKFYAVDDNLWKEIGIRYKNQASTPFTLDDLNIRIPKPSLVSEEEKSITLLKDLFKDKLEIMED